MCNEAKVEGFQGIRDHLKIGKVEQSCLFLPLFFYHGRR